MRTGLALEWIKVGPIMTKLQLLSHISLYDRDGVRREKFTCHFAEALNFPKSHSSSEIRPAMCPRSLV